jgi:hypothetical protein
MSLTVRTSSAASAANPGSSGPRGLRRAARATWASTDPGSRNTDRRSAARASSGRPAVGRVGLGQRLQFARGDDVLRLAAGHLYGAVQASGGADAFVGHVGGDDFVAITADEAAKAVVEDLIDRFDREVPSLYDPDDAARGFIGVENRRRQLERFPLVSLLVGSPPRPPGTSATTPRRVAAATEMKTLAKQQPGSTWAVDRRAG